MATAVDVDLRIDLNTMDETVCLGRSSTRPRTRRASFPVVRSWSVGDVAPVCAFDSRLTSAMMPSLAILIACSGVSQVKMPKITGTPVERLASATPLVAPPATWS